jgi:hypothetical protein
MLLLAVLAHAVPVATATTTGGMDISCPEPQLLGALPSPGEVVSDEVVPQMLFATGGCGLYGWYTLSAGDVVVEEGDAYAEEVTVSEALVRFDRLQPLEADTVYTLSFTTDWGGGGEVVFEVGSGVEAPEDVLPPVAELTVDDVVATGRSALVVFGRVTVEATPGTVVRVSDSQVAGEVLAVAEGEPLVFEVDDTVTRQQGEACFYAQATDAYGQSSLWTEACAPASVDDAETTGDDDDREPYTPKRCSTASSGGAAGLMGALLALGWRRRR